VLTVIYSFILPHLYLGSIHFERMQRYCLSIPDSGLAFWKIPFGAPSVPGFFQVTK